MKPETSQPISPIEKLYRTDFASLTPTDIQEAINYSDPSSAASLQDAEEILGFAEAGIREYPESPEWSYIYERAEKIFRHRAALRGEK